MSPATADQPLRALIYNRASADPSGRGLSVTAQERENRAWCEREGWAVAGVVTDNDRSATRWARREREGYQQVKQALAGSVFGRVDLLVCWESSRATRDMDGHVELRRLCEQHDVRFAAKGRVLDFNHGGDRFTGVVDAAVDERFADEARERTIRGHQTSVLNGTPRSYPGYGFRYVRDEHTGRLIGQEHDPDSAAVVQDIVARIIDGESLYRIAQSLNEEAVPTAMQRMDRWKGREVERVGWSSSTIRSLLRSQSLMGVRTWHGEAMRAGTWEPIVSPADWQQVQAILGERRNTGHDTRARTLLSGIATCGPCGAWMRPLMNRGRATYVCGGVTHTAPKGHVSRDRAALDAVVVRYVVGRLSDPGLIADVARRRSGDQERVDVSAREVADLEAEMEGYVRSAASRKGLARAAFEQVVDDLAGQIERKRAEMTVRAELPRSVLAAVGPDAAATWDAHDGDWEWQREVARALVSVTVWPVRQRGVREFEIDTIDITPR